MLGELAPGATGALGASLELADTPAGWETAGLPAGPLDIIGGGAAGELPKLAAGGMGIPEGRDIQDDGIAGVCIVEVDL